MIESKCKLQSSSQVALVVVICLVFLGYVAYYCTRFPFYWMWDQDQLLTIDLLLIKAGLLPAHFNHPGFGTYLLQAVVTSVAKYFNVISVDNIQDLALVADPMLSMGELVRFLRFISPCLILCYVGVSLYVVKSLNTHILFVALSAGVLLTQDWILYHSTIIRNELYSLCFVTMALGCTMLQGARIRIADKVFLLVLSGMFCGLSYFTKTQSVFAVLSIFIAGFLNKSTLESRFLVEKRMLLAISGITFISFVAIFIHAYSIDFAPGMFYIKQKWFISIFAIALVCLWCVCIAKFYKRVELSNSIADFFLHNATLVACGIVLTLLLHFSLGLDLKSAFNYLCYDFKIAFLRIRENPNVLDFKRLLGLVSYMPDLTIALMLTYSSLFYHYKKTPSFPFLSCIVFGFFAFLTVLLTARTNLRDLLWIESSVILFLLISIGLLWPVSRFNKLLGAVLLGMIIICNIYRLDLMHQRTLLYATEYGWNLRQWFKPVYGDNSRYYQQAMDNSYGQADTIPNIALTNLMSYAVRSGTLRQMLDASIWGVNTNLQRLVVLKPNSRLFFASSAKTKVVPGDFLYSLAYDLTNVLPNHTAYMPNTTYLDANEHLSQFTASAHDNIMLLGRQDLELMFFSVSANLLLHNLIKTPDIIAYEKNPHEEVLLYGYRVKQFVQLPIEILNKPSLVIIKPQVLW